MTALRQLLALAATVAVLCAGPLLISGCGIQPHPDSAPPPVQIVTADKEVRVPCIDPRDMPARPAPGVDINGNAKHDADILAARINQLWAIIDQFFALSVGCTN
jgi:hypothetical protein